MEQQILSRLKIKPVPKSIKTVEILLNRPELKDREDVFLKTNVVDKSRMGQIDRQAFLDKIQQNVATRQEERVREDVKADYEKTERDLEEKIGNIERERTAKTRIPETSIVIIIEISKTGRKITIGRDNIDVDIDTAPD